MPLSHALQVEHVKPKNLYPDNKEIELGWDNMLLACGSCNNAKSDQNIEGENYILPEQDQALNFFKAWSFPLREPLPDGIVYADDKKKLREIHQGQNACVIGAKDNLPRANKQRAADTIGLLKLNQIDLRTAIVDFRWKKRGETLLQTKVCRMLFDSNQDKEQAAKWIAIAAKGYGFFMLWYQEVTEPEVRKALIDQFRGTRTNAFDPNTYAPL
jgi:hypothetical protein